MCTPFSHHVIQARDDGSRGLKSFDAPKESEAAAAAAFLELAEDKNRFRPLGPHCAGRAVSR